MNLPPLVILAGGLATRLRPITETIPKSMVQVAGEPFVSHQLRLVRSWGFNKVMMCIGHMGEQIQDFVGDGTAYGLDVQYASDAGTQRGTGGAIRRCLDRLDRRFAVTYGDSYLDVEMLPIWHAYQASRAPALMTVFRNQGQWDNSNVQFDGHMVLVHDKVNRTPDMAYIDYGISFFDADLFRPYDPELPFDLATMTRDLARGGFLAGFEVTQRFYEVGSHTGLAECEQYLTQKVGRL